MKKRDTALEVVADIGTGFISALDEECTFAMRSGVTSVLCWPWYIPSARHVRIGGRTAYSYGVALASESYGRGSQKTHVARNSSRRVAV